SARYPSHDDGCRLMHDLSLAQAVAEDLGFGEMRDEIVCRFRAARGHLGGEERAEFLEGGAVLGGGSFYRFVGRHRQDDLAPDFGVIALKQIHGAEQQPDRDLAGEIVDELELPSFGYALQRAVGNIEGGRDQVFAGFARERRLAQRPQPVMPGRIGRSQRRTGAAGKLVDHIALHAPPERCRRSVKEPKACRFRSSSMDIAHAGFRNTERDWHRLPANRGRMLPSRARNLAYLPFGEAIMAAATRHLLDYCGTR